MWVFPPFPSIGAGRKFSVVPLASTSPHFPPYLSARASLCEQLGDLDGAVAEHILEHEDPARVPQEVVGEAVRCATIAQVSKKQLNINNILT